MSQFSGVNEALALTVERLERLHEVGERSRLAVGVNLFVDGQYLLELVLFLAYIPQQRTNKHFSSTRLLNLLTWDQCRRNRGPGAGHSPHFSKVSTLAPLLPQNPPKNAISRSRNPKFRTALDSPGFSP